MDAHDRLCRIPISCLAAHAYALTHVQLEDASGMAALLAPEFHVTSAAAHADALAGTQLEDASGVAAVWVLEASHLLQMLTAWLECSLRMLRVLLRCGRQRWCGTSCRPSAPQTTS